MPRRSRVPRRLALATAAIAVAVTGCFHVFVRTEARRLAAPATDKPTIVRTPVKAHLADGSTVVFRKGATVSRSEIAGAGEWYPLLSDVVRPRNVVPLDSVVGVETFEAKVLAAPTLAVSVAATAVGALGAAALAVAIFGSCPTVYADTGAGLALQAEGFSYAIAPLFEQRDVDPLRLRAGADGVVRLELRNEALETHFINHVELLAVRHPAGTRALPDQHGHAVSASAVRPLARATDRAGRDVRDALASADGRLFSTASATVDAAREGDLDDWIDLEAEGLPPGDSVAVVLRLRNSLLNTVLLYEGILGGRDAPDWLATGLQHIATAVDVSRWYVRTMGMRVSVEGAAPGAPSARLGDVGPIAFRDVAVVLPRPTRDAGRVRVRLRFVADNWRIDRAEVAGVIARPTVERLPVTRVVVPVPAVGTGPALDSAAVSAVADPDERYLETRPGQRMTLEFAPARASAGDSTTYLIAWQGWYREWIRGAWLAEPARVTPFVPGDSAVLTALGRWRARQPELERAFYASKIPVR
ncbi:MAG: hypothetical protein ACJ8AO_14225 [Gemmatimonadaceae bacterium]